MKIISKLHKTKNETAEKPCKVISISAESIVAQVKIKKGIPNKPK
jgi:hypothetical protein